MPLPVFVGCAVQYINNRTQQLLSKVPIVLEPLSNSPLLATITGSTYYGQLLHNISVVDATLFACRFTKLYRSYYPLPIPVIAKPVTAKDIAMKMLSTFIANGFMTRTFIALIILLTTLYFAIFIRSLKKRSAISSYQKSKTTAAESFLPAMCYNDIKAKQLVRDARSRAFAGSLIRHCFVAWFISLNWNFPAFIFNVYSELSTYLSTTPVQNIIKHALLMIFVFNFRSVARTVHSVSQRYIRGESSIKTIPTDLLLLFTFSGLILRQTPQFALELPSALYHGLISAFTPIYCIRENLNRPITLLLVKLQTNYIVNLPPFSTDTIDETDNQPEPDLEVLPELLEIVEEEIITPLSTSTALGQANLPHASATSDYGPTSNGSVPSPTELNQETLIVKVITSNSPLSTSNTLESIALPYFPVASGSGCNSNREDLIVEEAITSESTPYTPISESITLPHVSVASGSIPSSNNSSVPTLQPRESDEVILDTSSLAPVPEEIQPLITYETFSPGAWVAEPSPLESQRELLLRSFFFNSTFTFLVTDYPSTEERGGLTSMNQTLDAFKAKQAGFLAREADLAERRKLLNQKREAKALKQREATARKGVTPNQTIRA